MKGYVHNIEKVAQQNKTFRTVLYTAKNCQLVLMNLKPSEEIGAEVHKLDQLAGSRPELRRRMPRRKHAPSRR